MTAALAVTSSRAPGPADVQVGGRPVTNAELVRVNTGWHISPEHYRERAAGYEQLRRQTERLAEVLETQGEPMRIDVGDVVEIGAVTGEVSRSEAYRACCFLPITAQRERRPMLHALRYHQRADNHGEHFRYAVVTSGQRVPLYGDLRGRIQQLQRSISEWAREVRRHEVFGRHDIEVLFRGTEFTVDDELTFHPHANVIYVVGRRMPTHRWRAFLAWSGRFFGAHWQDNGCLQKPDEVIKYAFKPAELERLCDLAGVAAGPHGPQLPPLRWLYRETARLKLCQPMGSFRRFLWELDDRDNPDPAQRRRCKVAVVNAPGGARLRIVERGKRQAVDGGASNPLAENVVLCVSAPQFRFGPWAQSVIRVRNYTTEPRTGEGAAGLACIGEIKSAQRELWDENGAPAPEIARQVAAGQAVAEVGAAGGVVPFRVHTCGPTAGGATSGSGALPGWTQDLGVESSLSGPVWRAQATFTMEGGTMIDPETGEVLHEPPADVVELRRHVRAATAAHGDAVRQAAAEGLARRADARRFATLMAQKNSGTGRVVGRP